jgi:hypothetical protein
VEGKFLLANSSYFAYFPFAGKNHLTIFPFVEDIDGSQDEYN